MADLPARNVGDTGHTADHNLISSWLNGQGYNEGQDILNHVGFPADATKFLRGDGTFAVPPGAGSSVLPTSSVITYVAPGTSIQTAYDNLPSTGGAIVLMPGIHDLGSGTISMNKTKGVAFYGFPTRWRRYPTDFSGPGALPGAVIRTTGQYVFKFTENIFQNLNGVSFQNLAIDHKYTGGGTIATTGVSILGDNVSYGLVDNCYFMMGDSRNVAVAVFSQDSFLQVGTAHGDDASWWTVTNNIVRSGRLFVGASHWGGNFTGGNQNGHFIVNNVSHGGTLGGASVNGIGPNPSIWIRNGHRNVVRDNNLEGHWDPAIVFENCWACHSVGNHGENGTDTTGYFTEFLDSIGCFANDIGVSTAPAGVYLYHLTGTSHDNLMVSSALGSSQVYGGGYTYLLDDDTGASNYWIFPGHYKLGTAH